jgi:hypothetical protein
VGTSDALPAGATNNTCDSTINRLMQAPATGPHPFVIDKATLLCQVAAARLARDLDTATIHHAVAPLTAVHRALGAPHLHARWIQHGRRMRAHRGWCAA